MKTHEFGDIGMDKISSYDNIGQYDIKSLRQLAKELKIKGFYPMKKEELVAAIQKAAPSVKDPDSISTELTTTKKRGRKLKQDAKAVEVPEESNASPAPKKRGRKPKFPVGAAGTGQARNDTATSKSTVPKPADQKSAPLAPEAADTQKRKEGKPEEQTAASERTIKKTSPSHVAESASAGTRKPGGATKKDETKRGETCRATGSPGNGTNPNPKPTAIGKTPVAAEPSKALSLKEKLLRQKNLETPSSGAGAKDRLVLQVCGPFWLHAWWEISASIIARVRAAMGHLWHTADPILRLYRIVTDNAGIIHRNFAGDTLIHGGIYNWFLNVDNPPETFLVEIGYKAKDGRFFSLVSSNIVETPHNYIQESMGWSESGWRMLSSSTMHSPFETSKSSPGKDTPKPEGTDSAISSRLVNDRILRPQRQSPLRRHGFELEVDAEVVIKGRTSPDVQLTVRGERIWLKEDGTFLIRYHLPERRHVFPVVAVSRDGIDTKTIVLAVERNTKNLETIVHQQQGGSSDED